MVKIESIVQGRRYKKFEPTTLERLELWGRGKRFDLALKRQVALWWPVREGWDYCLEAEGQEPEVIRVTWLSSTTEKESQEYRQTVDQIEAMLKMITVEGILHERDYFKRLGNRDGHVHITPGTVN